MPKMRFSSNYKRCEAFLSGKIFISNYNKDFFKKNTHQIATSMLFEYKID